MREGKFIKNNVDRWNRYQNEEPKDPDEMASRFVNLLDDLSYSKTFYPTSNVTKWINGLAATIYQSIYHNRKHTVGQLFDFWRLELPLLFRKYHKVLFFTFLLFLSFVLIATLSAVIDPAYVRDYFDKNVQAGYYDVTLDNIKKGDPFGVYRDGDPFSMFVIIAYNNIKVAFLTVIGGIVFGFGTLYSLWNTGFMLGCFQYLFVSQGLGWQSVLVIWIHGTIEISSIVIAGCAGFVFAAGLLFPGTYPRKQSFLIGARDAIRICVALIPFFFIAAFFESYVTHLMSNTFSDDFKNIGLPVPLSILILLGSLLLMIWYFVLYPIRLQKKGLYLYKNKVYINGVLYVDEKM